MEVVSMIVSVCAFLFSVVAFIKSRQQQTAQFDVERDLSFEGRLADWPNAFALHGIDIKEAKSEGISPEQIAYLILSVNGLSAYCAANSISLYEQLSRSEYRQHMFAQSLTRQVWQFARLCIPSNLAGQIDRYISEKYGHQD